MSYYQFLDTSAVLNGMFNNYEHPYISTIVLQELEKIKNDAHKSEEIKYQARKAVKSIVKNNQIAVVPYNRKKIDKFLKKHNSTLIDNNDSRLIAEAALIDKSGLSTTFVTCDYAQYVLAKTFLPAEIALQKEEKIEPYTGWKKVYPSDEEFISVYTHPENNVFNCLINEFVELFEDNELKDVLFWNGTEYTKLKYHNFCLLGEKISARNIEQKMLLHILEDKNIPVIGVSGKFGSGKSFLTLSYALDEINHGQYDKIVFLKNNLETKGAGKLGTLPGSETEKTMPWLMQIADIIGEDLFTEYLERGIIEPVHLSGIRGRTFKNSIIIADEAENFLKTNIQLILSRVGEGSKIVFCGDSKQTDYARDTDSGFDFAMNRLKGNPLFSMVRLVKTERSAVAALADCLD